MTPPILLAGAAALLLCAVLTRLAIALGDRGGLLDTTGAAGHAKALRPIPNIGGVAIFATLALAIAAPLAAVWLGLVPGSSAVAEHAGGLRDRTPMALGLLAVLAGLHVLGLVDDRRALPAVPKLLVMLAAGLAAPTLLGTRILEFLDEPAGGVWLSYLATTLWLVAITNAINFLDNMDGVAAGVSATAAAALLLVTLAGQQWFVAALLAVTLGASLGFLVWNAPRRGGARIFMGDGGSLVLGYLLAFLAARATYVNDQTPGWWAALLPVCVLAVPLYDLLAVSLIRLAQGRSPLVGDQQHLTHRLRDRGLSDRRVLVVVCGMAAVTGLAGVALARLDGWWAALPGAQVVLAMVVLGIYEHGARRAADRGADG
jgi:UDP-GlcNAc:undecaprenyl-phosphate GlcNAc-1-phosphate transferase